MQEKLEKEEAERDKQAAKQKWIRLNGSAKPRPKKQSLKSKDPRSKNYANS